MKNKLFWRLFWAFVATLLLSEGVLSMLMIFMVRSDRQQTLENEVLVQARDVALLMKQQDQTLWLWRQPIKSNNEIIDQKIAEIRDTYGADVWLVSATGGIVILGNNEYTTNQINDADVIEQLRKVLNGAEIRIQGLIPELGSDIVTIGVPLFSGENRVIGAVLMHISTEQLQVDYSDMIRNAVVACCVSMLLGAFLAYVIAKRQSRPIKQLQDAVEEFSKGNMETRVNVGGDYEMQRLGESINQMVQQLSTLEESRRSFVANVSHELRSPLTSMQGYIQGFLDGTIPDDERDRYLNVVLSETKRLTKLVNELLDLSRFESGKITLSRSAFDLNELIAVTLFTFEKRIDDKNIDVEVNFHERQVFVDADADRIRQVITNLVDNAVKFLREKGHLIVETYTVDNNCIVNISNDGPQIPPDDLPFVFDRFYKADKAHTVGKGGTGLGLSIVKLILTQHGQSIHVTSGPALTTFSFTLKRVAPPQSHVLPDPETEVSASIETDETNETDKEMSKE